LLTAAQAQHAAQAACQSHHRREAYALDFLLVPRLQLGTEDGLDTSWVALSSTGSHSTAISLVTFMNFPGAAAGPTP
jgi:hypothetical protein